MTWDYVLSAEQMRAVDADAVAQTGLPSLLLMENAGRGVAAVVRRRVGAPARRRRVVAAVVCGGGNNGGDGFVVARHLALAGDDVRVLLAVPPSRIAGDARIMLRALDGLVGVAVTDLSASTPAAPTAGPDGAADVDTWTRGLSGTDVIIDALFGTGLRSRVTGAPAAAIAAMNAAGVLTVAVDVPSGLNADTGRADGPCVRADVTVTMGARKLGLVIDPDAPVGDIAVVRLGVPLATPSARGPYAHWLDRRRVIASLPVREGSAHKGTGGHLLVVAGSVGKTGSALLTARAALRAGAGLVTIASTRAGQAALDAKVLEAMTVAFAHGDDADDADDDSFERIREVADRLHVRAVALGPGIPLGAKMRALVHRLCGELTVPMVIDADGLNLLGAQAVPILSTAAGPRVITPHPGEMARLTGKATADVQGDRLGVAREFAAASGATVVLKGARTLVVAPDGTAFVNPAVEPALATAGSGDVLTGVLGALLAQGMEPLAASRAAVFLHASAGTKAAAGYGGPGVIAGDLPEMVAAVRAGWAAGSAKAVR